MVELALVFGLGGLTPLALEKAAEIGVPLTCRSLEDRLFEVEIDKPEFCKAFFRSAMLPPDF